MSLCHFSKQWKYLGSYILCLRYFLPLPSPPAPPPLRQSLDYAGDNAADLQAVLDKYEAEGDGLKLAAAEFLISRMDEAADHLTYLTTRLHEGVVNRLKQERTRLNQCRHRIPAASVRRISTAKLTLLTVRKDLHRSVETLLSRHHHRLELLRQRLSDASPDKLLARGYSLTLKDGKAVKDASQLQAGDVLTTKVYKGEITSTVKSIK